jgi:uncharacterized coiled-coil protein SlyX
MSFIDDGPGVDFDDLMGAWNTVALCEETVSRLERKLETTRAFFKEQALADREQWPLGKPPSAEYLKQITHYVGNTSDQANLLEKLSSDLEEAQKNLTISKGKLDAMHEKIRIFQTMSANARRVSVE